MKTLLRYMAVVLLLVSLVTQVQARVTTATVSTTLDDLSVVRALAPTPFVLSIRKGDVPEGTEFKGVVKLTGDNAAAQASEVNLEYSLDKGLNWVSLPLNATGEATFGNYPINDYDIDFRVTFQNIGTYNYALELQDVATTAVLASQAESVTVTFNEPTINSTLDNISQNDVIATGADVLFEVFLKAEGRAGETVTTKLILDNPADRSKFKLKYATNLAETEFETLQIGEDGVAVFGPAEGFTLADMEQLFKINFSEPGTFSYTIQVLKGEDVLGFSNETITVVEGNASIASTLDDKIIRKDVVHNFTVEIGKGAWGADTKYRVRVTLADPAQRAAFSLATAEGTPVSLAFNDNGVAYLGDVEGLALTEDVAITLKATATEYGVYNYTLELLRVIADRDPQVIAKAEENVTVAYVDATIASTLNQRENVKTTMLQDVNVTTVANDDAGATVRVKLTLADATQRDNVALKYRTDEGTFAPLPINENGVAYFGPAEGFPLTDATTAIRATFNEAGTYVYTLAVVTAGGTETVVASKEERVLVAAFQDATVATTLANQQISKDAATMFSITSTAGDVAPTTLVRGRLTLATPANATHVMLEYLDADGTTYRPITIGADGVALIGPEAGMALSQINGSAFRVAFDAAGSYTYTLSLYEVDGGKVVATATESVEVVAPTAITKGTEKSGYAIYPTLVTSIVKIDLADARNASIQIIDMMGRTIISKSNVGGIVALDLSQVAKGTYVVKIQDGSRVNTQRVVVR
ncbi:T9SS type A sorting domain-containing protein [Pontibacter sp. MBLB2868]|uniref:T9SS type A sorting domain-containing protein n=1 Tax=Pontibacter sp. MBLB2868 TaxID=3451555 RepID=UPI003F754572